MPATKKRQSLKNKKKLDMSAPTTSNRNSITVASEVADSERSQPSTSIADSEQPLSSPPSTSPSSADSPEKEKEKEKDQDQNQSQNQARFQLPEEDQPRPQPHPQLLPEQTEAPGPDIVSFQAVNSQLPASTALVLNRNDSQEDIGDHTAITPNLNAAVTIPEFDMTTFRATNGRNGYESSNLDDITIRQLSEDVHAYTYDLNWCRSELAHEDLTPQEARTLQLRVLDLTHQIRHCNSRIETLQFQTRRAAPRPVCMPQLGSFNPVVPRPPKKTAEANASPGPIGGEKHGRDVPATEMDIDGADETGSRPATPSANENGGLKRPAPEGTPDSSPESGAHKRIKTHVQLNPVHFDEDTAMEDIKGPILAMQRLGFWKCQLCNAAKYLLAGVGRSPAQPCKWPLRDISKMITHFTAMHREHGSADRLAELGAALELNRGPFEYWLRRTRQAKLENDDDVQNCLDVLKSGRMPGLLRRYNTAAAKMRV